MLTITGSGRPLPVRKWATVSIGFCVAERPMRAGGLLRQGFQPLQRDGEVGAALVVGDGVNFVDDHRLHIVQNAAALLGG